MTDEQALYILKRYFNGDEMKARDVSMAFMIVSSSLRQEVTMEQLREWVLTGKQLWIDEQNNKGVNI